jgi:hypothetical protein
MSDHNDDIFDELVRNELADLDGLITLVTISVPLDIAVTVLEARDHVRDHGCLAGMQLLAEYLKTSLDMLEQAIDEENTDDV